MLLTLLHQHVARNGSFLIVKILIGRAISLNGNKNRSNKVCIIHLNLKRL